MIKKILVTGSTGFVGRTLCPSLQSQGIPVRAVVRKQTLNQIINPPEGEIAVIDDIDRNTVWEPLLADVDTVIHLAARVHVMKETAANYEEAYLETNLYGSERLAKASAAVGVKRFIYMSSVKVNGEGADKAYTENDQPTPQNLYDGSKWQAEKALKKVAQETGIELVILRPPLVYGPNVKANFLRLIKFVDRQIPLPLAGIKNRRSMVYIGNLIDAIIKCARHPEAAGETFFVSDDHDLSTPDIVDLIASALNKRSHLFYFPEIILKLASMVVGRQAEVKRLCNSLFVDVSKIKTLIDWTPPFSVEQGIKKTVDWYKKQ